MSWNQNGPHQPAQYPQQQQTPAPQGNRNVTVVGGWSAAQNNMEFGKHLEYVIESIPTPRGGTFETVEFFKPFVFKTGAKAGQVGRGHGIPFKDGHRQLVEKINHMIMNFGDRSGQYIFQPAFQQQGPNGYPAQQPPAPNYGYQAPQPQYQQQAPQPISYSPQGSGPAPQPPQPINYSPGYGQGSGVLPQTGSPQPIQNNYGASTPGFQEPSQPAAPAPQVNGYPSWGGR